MDDRPDLGAMLARLARRVIDRERPLLAARGLTMWGYIVLTRLAEGDVLTQLRLAADIGHDKTRLIKDLEALEADGLISREPDPADRRAHLVRLTAKGRRRFEAARKDIRAMESDVLGQLDEPDDLLRALSCLDRRAG